MIRVSLELGSSRPNQTYCVFPEGYVPLESPPTHHRGHPDAMELAGHGVQPRGAGFLPVERFATRQEHQAGVTRGA